MRKLVLCTIVLLLILGTVGCSGREKSINANDISSNTFLAKSNGELQVAVVEDFNKAYYELNGLKDYINQCVSDYNKKVGADNITVDSVEVKEEKAIMILTFKGMQDYSTFYNVTAAYFNGGVKDITLKLPATLINSKDGSLVSTQEILQNQDYRILVLNEPYDIMVDGKIKFYSENVTFKDNSEVQSVADGMSIVVYKP
jgi:hypothetical protein